MHYAYHNTYGVGTRHADDGKRIGHLRIFETKAERDAWVSADVCDGHYKREAITYREALPELVQEASFYSGIDKEECRARGAAWMCKAVLYGTSEGLETAQAYGIDW